MPCTASRSSRLQNSTCLSHPASNRSHHSTSSGHPCGQAWRLTAGNPNGRNRHYRRSPRVGSVTNDSRPLLHVRTLERCSRIPIIEVRSRYGHERIRTTAWTPWIHSTFCRVIPDGHQCILPALVFAHSRRRRHGYHFFHAFVRYHLSCTYLEYKGEILWPFNCPVFLS